MEPRESFCFHIDLKPLLTVRLLQLIMILHGFSSPHIKLEPYHLLALN